MPDQQPDSLTVLKPGEHIIQVTPAVNPSGTTAGVFLLTNHSRLLAPSKEPGVWLVIPTPRVNPDTTLPHV